MCRIVKWIIDKSDTVNDKIVCFLKYGMICNLWISFISTVGTHFTITVHLKPYLLNGTSCVWFESETDFYNAEVKQSWEYKDYEYIQSIADSIQEVTIKWKQHIKQMYNKRIIC